MTAGSRIVGRERTRTRWRIFSFSIRICSVSCCKIHTGFLLAGRWFVGDLLNRVEKLPLVFGSASSLPRAEVELLSENRIARGHPIFRGWLSRTTLSLGWTARGSQGQAIDESEAGFPRSVEIMSSTLVSRSTKDASIAVDGQRQSVTG